MSSSIGQSSVVSPFYANMQSWLIGSNSYLPTRSVISQSVGQYVCIQFHYPTWQVHYCPCQAAPAARLVIDRLVLILRPYFDLFFAQNYRIFLPDSKLRSLLDSIKSINPKRLRQAMITYSLKQFYAFLSNFGQYRPLMAKI